MWKKPVFSHFECTATIFFLLRSPLGTLVQRELTKGLWRTLRCFNLEMRGLPKEDTSMALPIRRSPLAAGIAPLLLSTAPCFFSSRKGLCAEDSDRLKPWSGFSRACCQNRPQRCFVMIEVKTRLNKNLATFLLSFQVNWIRQVTDKGKLSMTLTCHFRRVMPSKWQSRSFLPSSPGRILIFTLMHGGKCLRGDPGDWWRSSCTPLEQHEVWDDPPKSIRRNSFALLSRPSIRQHSPVPREPLSPAISPMEGRK